MRRHGLTPEESVKKLTQHGVRKGSANACTTGVICGPSIMSVCLRAEWSIGDVLSRYFRFEAAGDQFVAKVAALHDPCDINFAYLPAHFKPTNDEDVLAKIKDATKTQFGEYLCEMGNLMPVLELSLVVLLERKGYLGMKLGGSDPIRRTPLFADPIKFNDELVGLVTHDADDMMRPTGVPPYTAIMVQNARIEKKIDGQNEAFGKMLDTKISQMVHDHGNMSGTHMDEKINGLFKKLEKRDTERAAAMRVEDAAGGEREGGGVNVEEVLVGNPKRLCIALDWKDGEGFRRFGKGFTFPESRVKQGWTLWWQGSAPENVPFRIINAKRDIFVDGSKERTKQKKLVTEWRRVYLRMESLSQHIAQPQEIDRFSEPWVAWISESFAAAYTPQLSHIVPAATDQQTKFPTVTYLASRMRKKNSAA